MIDTIKENYNAQVVNAMDRLLVSSTFCFDCLDSVKYEKHSEILGLARDIYSNRGKFRVCSICKHTELIIDQWASESLCVNCSRIRNNRSRVEEMLRSGR